MTLEDFLLQTQATIDAEVEDRSSSRTDFYPHPEPIFTEVVMQHMADIGMTFEPIVCHHISKSGNAVLRLNGYAVSEEADQLDLFVSLYDGVREPTPISDADTKAAAEQCIRFLARCAEGRLTPAIEADEDVHGLALTIRDCYPNLHQVRIYVITDRQAKTKNFKSREVNNKTIKLEVMDIERLYRHWAAGKPRDELIINFEEICGAPVPCVYVPAGGKEYDYALTALPATVLDFAYSKYGARLLEANVRSFLSTTGKVNRGIRDTLRDNPGRFMAYNNGIVIVADEARLGRASDGSPGLLWLRGMQIVNGGQTTASIYFSKKRNPEISLSAVRVPAKIIVLQAAGESIEEHLISDISRFANSQNAVRVSDLSANKPFHVELEKHSSTTYCPDGVSRWFYERAAGSYNVMLSREGTTPAKLRNLREAIPPARRITKTDLAKYLNAWAGLPHITSLGAQKNFERFMEALGTPDNPFGMAPSLNEFKHMISITILFRSVQRQTRGKFQQIQGQLAAYVVALIGTKLADRLSLDVIWARQQLSDELSALTIQWAEATYEVIRATGGDRLLSEWVKKPECWESVRDIKLPLASARCEELAKDI